MRVNIAFNIFGTNHIMKVVASKIVSAFLVITIDSNFEEILMEQFKKIIIKSNSIE